MQLINTFIVTTSIASFTGVSWVSAAPFHSQGTSLMRRSNPTCGMDDAGDAKASDCQSMIDGQWNNLQWTGDDHTCGAADKPRWKPVCVGSCCLYTSKSGVDVGTLKSAATNIMSCADKQKDKVNGNFQDDKNNQYCLADKNSCSHCFFYDPVET